MDILRYAHTESDRVREVLATSGERAFYDRSTEWVLVDEDDAEPDAETGDGETGDGDPDGDETGDETGDPSLII